MIEKIVAKLEAPKPVKTVYIHDIATKEEIKKAEEYLHVEHSRNL